MTRISRTQLVQPVDVEVGARPDAVIIDESTGEEVVVQAEYLLSLEQAVYYVRMGALHPSLASQQAVGGEPECGDDASTTTGEYICNRRAGHWPTTNHAVMHEGRVTALWARA